MRPCRLIGSANGGNPGRRLMRRPRAGLVTPAPGRPWPAVRRHYDRLPAVLRNDGLHAAATKERWPPLRIGGLNTGPVAARKYGPKGLQERRKWSAGRRLVPIARDEETPRKRLIGRLRQPLRERSQAPASAGAPLPSGSRELEFARRRTRRRPNNTGDESCPARSRQARRALHWLFEI